MEHEVKKSGIASQKQQFGGVLAGSQRNAKRIIVALPHPDPGKTTSPGYLTSIKLRRSGRLGIAKP